MDRWKKLMPLLGQHVHVQVDRPISYNHDGIIYPVNYGFIPGMPGGDGEDQDAYILGVREPVQQFDGEVIGIILRHDDAEDKLVVAPHGTVLNQAQIGEAVRFQEQFFHTSVIARFCKSCGVIPFRERNGQREYLILLQTNHCWSFPKGHMEPFETEEQTAMRELQEETGLIATLKRKQRIISHYPLSGGRTKELVLFPGEVSGQFVPQTAEVLGHRWVTFDRLAHYLQPDTMASVAALLKSH